MDMKKIALAASAEEYQLDSATLAALDAIDWSQLAPESWIGFDFDGSLVKYTHFEGQHHIGEPLPEGIALARYFLSKGVQVKLFTARVCKIAEAKNSNMTVEEIKAMLAEWSQAFLGRALEATNVKDFLCIGIADDRGIQIKRNKGSVVSPDHLAEALVPTF